MKKVIATDGAPSAVGPYSQAIDTGNTIYVSGQLPVDPHTKAVSETIEGQTTRSLDNMKAILEAAGYSLSNVVKTTVLLDDISNFGAMNAIYAGYFTSDMPARICYEVAKLPFAVKVEIDCIAVKG